MAQKYKAQQVADAIKETRGFITYTARYLGCDRTTVYRYIDKYEICKQAVEDARGGFLDMAELTLYNKIKDGDITATIFALKTLGKSRGYSERHELTGADGNTLAVKIEYENDYS
jgi:hypothetical protein